MKTNSAVRHFYKLFRDHQMASDGFITKYPGGRTELSYGGAAYGYHASAALSSAKAQVAFRKRLKDDVRQINKRSRAAKKGWKTRKAKRA